MTWPACPHCGCLGMGPFGMAMHIARRHPTEPPADAHPFTATQQDQIARCRADSLRLAKPT